MLSSTVEERSHACGLVPSLHESVHAYPAAFSNENGDACGTFWSADCVGVVSAFAGTLRGLWLAYLLQFKQLCPSSSETRTATCLICELWR